MSAEARLVDALTKQLFELVEPNTRFDRTSLLLTAQRAAPTPVSGHQTFAVAFGATRSPGRGRLPSSVREVASRTDLDAFLARQVATYRQELPSRLRAWLGTQTELPGATLGTGDCYDGCSHVGYEFTCGPCQGAGKTRCTRCSGHGQTTCTTCDGTSRVTCRQCGGSARISCAECGGHRYVRVAYEVVKTNHADNRTWTETEYENRPCFRCGSQGSLPCSCGSGRRTCTECTFGKVTCGTCGGAGTEQCAACDATGIQNEQATIDCSITQGFALRAPQAPDEAKRTLEALPSVRALCDLTRVESPRASVADDGLSRDLVASVWLTTVELRAAEQSFTLLGYGDRATIMDFKNVVGALLQSDLEELEQALAEAPRLPLGPVTSLDASLERFLQSEINDRIGHVVGGGPAALEAFARDELRSAVSGEYVLRASRAVRGAITRIHVGEIARPSLWICGAVAVVAQGVPRLSLALHDFAPGIAIRVHDLAPFAAVALLVGGVALVEYRARAALAARFADDLGPKVLSLLTGGRTLWRVRGAIATTALAGTLAFGFLARAATGG